MSKMIVEAEERDGPAIGNLTAAAGVFKPVEIACVEELWNAYRQQGEASGYVFLVYREGERVLGYACFGPHPLTEGTFDLYWIAVDPETRGQGIARALMERVEDEVRQRGGRLLVVETSSTPDYVPARRFYESCGYGQEALIHDFYAPGDDLVIYTRRLSPASHIAAR
ncbi:MAG: GNAT family N-acetyltransferase [Anaerolineae bacterium]|nr:GNAT family N-acetyltransferase [Anaerolineae bacterium]